MFDFHSPTKQGSQSQKSLSSQAKTKKSLARRTLIQIAFSVTAVIVGSTAISYFQIVSTLKSQTLDQLKSHVIERGQREQSIFLMAEDNHAIFKEEWLRRLENTDSEGVKARFDQLFVRFPDGATRNRPNLFDGKRQAGVFIDKPVLINDDIRRRVVTSYDLINAYGPPWHNRFPDLYLNMPENIAVIYWPDYPTWAQDAPVGFDLSKEEYVWVGDQKHNPARETVWSGAQIDGVAKIWILSCVTPIYSNDRIIGTLGQDVLLNDLFKRTIEEHIEGGYNLIFRKDGRLIAHPQLMEQIQQQKGEFKILESGDTQLKRIFEAVTNKATDQVVIDNPNESNYLAVTTLQGPDWYFVTVLPKAILAEKAISLARFTLFLGFGSLMIVVAIVFWVLRRRIATPLEEITVATNRIANGEFQVVLDDSSQDELGRLAQAFNTMIREVAAKTTELEAKTTELEAKTTELQRNLEQQAISVNQTTATMDELNTSSRQAAEQAEAAATGARQVLILIDDREQKNGSGTASSLKAKVEQIGEQILHFRDQTTQINAISNLVSDLANQTNMLALNAAVEAVRAGENGRGFAVVAAEIRKLADRSRKSAEQISELVASIQKATKATVAVSDEGRKTVEEIVDAVNTITVNSQQISLTAKQQSSGIQQVVSAMNALSQAANRG
ncbi:methyl-accepting chemotaxis protein [Coleofasciculus sp. FACHB-129]|uniref:methyl-accepting chemotaxis protein n=1 Tax=Cyanophyceae TaxID=3028117 RepID=UPI001682F401|nr:methyl-accepting chemotaxis protein [Coleofasciculus sp. FACHB-129]MBD1893906.1 HAMP domain-containing protein [Coleofasciculus sp. FACHB-129]